MKVQMKVVGAELERPNAPTERVIAEQKRSIDHEVKRWEEKHQVLASELDLIEECQRKNVVVVFGPEEKRNEDHMDAVEIIQKFLKDVTKPDV